MCVSEEMHARDPLISCLCEQVKKSDQERADGAGEAHEMNKIFEAPLYPYARHADQDALSPVHHQVIVIGAGPIGLAMAVDLAQQGIQTLLVDENDKVSFGSRAICFSKRALEIADRLGFGDRLVAKGVRWNLGKVFFDERKVYEFNLLPEEGHKHPAFINLQQYYFEEYLVDRVREMERAGAPIELRGESRVIDVVQNGYMLGERVIRPALVRVAQ